MILSKSTKYVTSSGEQRVLINKGKLQNYIEKEMKEGKRVLALAMSDSDKFESLTLIGFIFLKDKFTLSFLMSTDPSISPIIGK